MSLSAVTKVPRWPPVTSNKINGSLGKNVVLHHQFIIILPLYALNNKKYSGGVLNETCDFDGAVSVNSCNYERKNSLHTKFNIRTNTQVQLTGFTILF